MARNGSSGDDSREGSRSSSRNNSLGQGPQDSGSGGRRGTRVRMTSAQISTALREAQQFQQEGRLDSSIQICEELEESGVERPDVYYFLGWLYQEAGRWQDAAAQFERLPARWTTFRTPPTTSTKRWIVSTSTSSPSKSPIS